MKKDIDFEGLICPACSCSLDEESIKESLVCVECKADLQDSKYLDFIEYLVANGIVKDIDFFDMKIYRDIYRCIKLSETLLKRLGVT